MVVVSPDALERSAKRRGRDSLPRATHKLCRGLCNVLSCRCDKLWAFIVGPLFPERSVGSFVDGTLAYTLSKTWHDLITAYLVPLNPVPYCDPEADGISCTPAGSRAKFLYAVLLLLPAALVKYAAGTRAFAGFPAVDSLPSMVGMLAGWGLGDACTQMLVELKAASGGAYCTPAPAPYEGMPADCSQLDMAFASALTIGAAILIMYLQPLTVDVQIGTGVRVPRLSTLPPPLWAGLLPPPRCGFR